jgi:predicted RNA methylase
MEPKFKTWVEAMGFDADTLTADQISGLQANYAGQNAPKKTEINGGLSGFEAKKAERARVDAITDYALKACDSQPHNIDSIKELAEQAIEAKWPLDKFRLELLEASAPSSYSPFVGRRDERMSNKVLEAAGGKWDRKTKTHIFDSDAEERMDQILTTGEVTIPKDEFEFFPTPPAVVERVRALADIRMTMKVLEPSAGLGALIEGMNQVHILAVEKMPENAQWLRDHAMVETVLQADFLDVEPDPVFDRVIMNPPFSKRQDIKHVMHALKFLKPGGRLVAVMPSSVNFRQDKLTADFRKLITHMERLPEGSFKSSGTMVGTVIVVIDKS